ncbi:histidine--tRNA ligase [Candidatus Endowatersipora endosymbiont of Watersipora subatra]|uniref:histidine--tRNA ligase n=1 Tax=Candidatus Endowatersipora endosymbiont of Watersipora subatra TaxID=3077946 RepID=UPI00312C7A29
MTETLKSKQLSRLKACQPRGVVDRSSHDIRITEAMMIKIRDVYEQYGFDPIETPIFEYTDVLGKFLPDIDPSNDGFFSLQDSDEKWISLRYDLTTPLARHFAQNINTLQVPYRTYRSGWVFRDEKPGPDRFRQFMQFDVDTVGAPSSSADAEMCMMMADTMEALGIARGDYIIRVNNRKVLDGIMDIIGLNGNDNAYKRLTVLRSIDKLDKVGELGVKHLLGTGLTDESGDFIKGAGLSIEQIDMIIGYMHGEISPSLKENASYMQGYSELDIIASLVDRAGYSLSQIKIDPSVVRGLEYYTGSIYECELTFPITNENSEMIRFGAVAGGGRYDRLIKRFTGLDIPATGFSIGVSRLKVALKKIGKFSNECIKAPVIVCVMDRHIEAVAEYQSMVQDLRNAGIRVEMYQGNPKRFGKQLQYADRRGSPIAIIQGSHEREAGQVQVKNLIEGKCLAKEMKDHAEWRKNHRAYRLVARDQLVSVVQEILAEQVEVEKNQNQTS